MQVEPGKPGHFCAPVAGLGNDTPLSVAPYPVAWRIEVVNDDIHSGFDYVRSECNLTPPTGTVH